MYNFFLPGPPENVREHVLQAARALMLSDWEKCRDLILSIKVWDFLPNKEAILEMLAKRIQEDGLQTYLYTYNNYYESLSLDHLARYGY